MCCFAGDDDASFADATGLLYEEHHDSIHAAVALAGRACFAKGIGEISEVTPNILGQDRMPRTHSQPSVWPDLRTTLSCFARQVFETRLQGSAQIASRLTPGRGKIRCDRNW